MATVLPGGYAPLADADGRIAISIKDAEQAVRAGFVRKVYAILSFQLLLTVAVAAPICQAGEAFVLKNQWLMWLSCGMTIATVCAMTCCRDAARSFPTNYMLLFTFTAFEGVMVGCISAMYTWQSVMLAACMTVCIFLAMTAFACFTKTDFTGCGGILLGALCTMIGVSFTIGILGWLGVNIQPLMLIYDAVGALIFTIYIVFDTQMIIGGNHKVSFSIDDYVFAALNLYLDIINLFLFLLQLFGDRK